MGNVLIAGAGPTGLAAALFLGERGIRSRVIEKKLEPSPYSKAFGVNPRTLELLENTGVTEQLLAQGWRMSALNLWQNNHRLLRLDFSRVTHRFPFMLIHSQAKTEALLAEAASKRGVQIERGVKMEQVEASQNKATATLRSSNGDEQIETATASYLLGADGSNSVVREKLDIGFSGSAYEEAWRLYDLVLDVPLPRDEAHAFLLDGGAMFMVRIEGDVWRVLGNVPDLFNRLPQGSRAGRVEWESDFGISHRIAEHFQKGRVCLAGDAAHIHSGLGARGMNLGVEDAYVFAALVAEGRLEDYERLRRPVVKSVMRTVERMTEIPRGRSLLAKTVRTIAPVFAPFASFMTGSASEWILGLDHKVGID
jgi:2-polyprenyl-6-methoxyphenol hydroxylase-like FAD-dependent oxidoreductase